MKLFLRSKGRIQTVTGGYRLKNVVGHINLYQYFDDEVALQKAFRCWEFIKKNLIDPQNGEWYWSIRADGTVNTGDDKAGFWKCPYHNGRMCMEIMERFS